MVAVKRLAALMALGLVGVSIPLAARASQSATRSFSVAELVKAKRHKVVTQTSREGGHSLRVSLQPGLAESEMYDKPTFVLFPMAFEDGVIDVDVMSRTLPQAPELARAFVGIAYRISSSADRFEAVYLRPTNGRSLNPPAPRDKRAVQWFAFPDWPFSRLRRAFPDGPYETGADVAPNRWMHLRLKIHQRHVVAEVDGMKILDIESREVPASGALGLWVDIGTEAFFKNLKVSPSPDQRAKPETQIRSEPPA